MPAAVYHALAGICPAGFSSSNAACPADQTLLRCAASKDTGSASSITASHTDETQEEALKRRLRESARVEERVTPIYTKVDFDDQLAKVRQRGAHFVSSWRLVRDTCQLVVHLRDARFMHSARHGPAP